MKKFQRNFSLFDVSILFICVILASSWQNPARKNSNIVFKNVNYSDTIPGNSNNKDFNLDEINKSMQNLDKNMAGLEIQMKNLNLNIDKQIQESISKINFDEIQKQTEASLKQIDWDKMQQQVDNSLQKAKTEVAQIDFNKMQSQMKELQEKMQSKEFQSQFNSEKLHQQINDAMISAKEGIEKVKKKLQELNDFTNALQADGLIDKKKGYTIEWKNGDLYINDKVQPKDISDKYRKYENDFKGKIKMLPDGAEHF